MTAWTILQEFDQRNIPAKWYWQWSIGFWQEDFLTFLYRYILYTGKISPAPPGAHVFWRIQIAWIILVEDTFLQNYIEIGPVVSDKKVFKVFFIDYIGKISTAPWRPCFLTNLNGLNNIGRGSPKEHFCKIILKLVQWFLTKRSLKFSI